MRNNKAQVGFFVFLLIVFAILIVFTVFYLFNADLKAANQITSGDYKSNGVLPVNSKSTQTTSSVNSGNDVDPTEVTKKKPKSIEELIYPCRFGEYDLEGDDVPDYCDNCLMHYNPEQQDYDFDGIGNQCDDEED